MMRPATIVRERTDHGVSDALTLTMVRAMTFKLPMPNASSETPPANFAVHLEIGGARAVGIAEGLITRFESFALSSRFWLIAEQLCRNLTGRDLYLYRSAFPSSLWLIVEELCRNLVSQDGSGRSREQLLCDASRHVAESLEKQGQVELANGLWAAIQRNSGASSLVRLRQWLSLGFNMRRRCLNAALVKLLRIFAAALDRLDSAPSKNLDDFRERYYEPLLNCIQLNCCFPEPPLPSFQGKPANIYPDAAFLQSHPKDATKGHLLEREALAHGLGVLRFPNGSFIAFDRNGKRLNFKWSRSPISSAVSLALCCHKEATRARLRRCGLPVPRGRTFAGGDYEPAAAYADYIGYPVVLKPAAGLRGIGVISSIQNENALMGAFQLHAQSELGLDDFIVEEHVVGADYRIVVIGGQVVSAICREPASVLGNGVHTVLDLVLFKNRLRSLNPHLRRRLISFDQATFHMLLQAGLTLQSVPTEGQLLRLATSNNISRGGDSIEVVDELHPSIKEASVRAVEAIPGLGFCGLDILLEDHSKPLNEQIAAIIELNAHGAIGTGQYPMWGTPRNVAQKLLLYCAESEGLVVSDLPAQRLSVKVQVRGRVAGVGYRRWFRRKAIEYNITGWIAHTNRTTLEAVLEGDTAPVAALVNAAVRGTRRAVPYWVRVEHVRPSAIQHSSEWFG